MEPVVDRIGCMAADRALHKRAVILIHPSLIISGSSRACPAPACYSPIPPLRSDPHPTAQLAQGYVRRPCAVAVRIRSSSSLSLQPIRSRAMRGIQRRRRRRRRPTPTRCIIHRSGEGRRCWETRPTVSDLNRTVCPPVRRRGLWTRRAAVRLGAEQRCAKALGASLPDPRICQPTATPMAACISFHPPPSHTPPPIEAAAIVGERGGLSSEHHFRRIGWTGDGTKLNKTVLLARRRSRSKPYYSWTDTSASPNRG